MDGPASTRARTRDPSVLSLHFFGEKAIGARKRNPYRSPFFESDMHIFFAGSIGLMRFLYAALILLLILAPSAQCQQTAQEWSDKGTILLMQGKFDEAIKAYDESIRLDPKDAMTWSNKGITLGRDLGKYEEAIQCFDKAIEINPKYANAWINKGSALNDQGKYDKAIKTYDEAIRLDPNYAESGSTKVLLFVIKASTRMLSMLTMRQSG